MQTDNRPYILFVDDEQVTRKMFERIAAREFRVLTADSVAGAREILDRHGQEIGVLLTDQRMPGGLGVELLEYCREAYPDIVRMLTTAYSDLADAIAAVNRGEIMRYIEKPWTNIDALLIDLRVAMRFHSLELENRKLLGEKLDVGRAISRTDRVRSLIAIAAAQSSYSNALRAVEALLRDLAQFPSVEDSDIAASDGDTSLFARPVVDTLAVIAVADELKNGTSASVAGQWREWVLRENPEEWQISGLSSLQKDVQEQIASLSLAAWLAMGREVVQPQELRLFLEVSSTGGWQMAIESNGVQGVHPATWISGGDGEAVNRAMAALLRLYLLAGEMDAIVNLGASGSRIGRIEVIPGGVKPGQEKASTASWVDDLLLLHS